jgi:hypothetical protein
VKTLTNGALVRVRALTVLPSEISPLYLVDHPVELLKTFWTLGRAQLQLTAHGAEGADRHGCPIRHADHVGEGSSETSRSASALSWGIGSAAMIRERSWSFDARLGRATTTPAVTITSADVVGTVQALRSRSLAGGQVDRLFGEAVHRSADHLVPTGINPSSTASRCRTSSSRSSTTRLARCPMAISRWLRWHDHRRQRELSDGPGLLLADRMAESSIDGAGAASAHQ